MLKALIVDDEPLVREGLKNIIPWEEYNFSICGEGIDGRDGLNKILELKPDLVLMDIKMPGLYGIEVIKSVRETGYDCKFIILTGYSDFQYAKSSIELGVCSYLLKPIDEDELIDTVKKVGREIIEGQKIKKHIENSERYIKSESIRQLLINKDNIRNDGDVFDKQCYSYRVAIVDTREGLIDRDKINKVIIQEIDRRLGKDNSIKAVIIDSKVTILFLDKGEAVILEILNKLCKEIKLSLNEAVFIALGTEEKNYRNISSSYENAKRILDKKFFFQKDKHIVSQQDMDFKYREEGMFAADTFNEEIAAFVEINDKEKIEEALKRLGQYLVKTDYCREKIKSIYVNIYMKIKYKLINNYDELITSLPADEEIIQRIYEMERLEQITDYLKSEFVGIAAKIGNNCSGNVMKRVLSYIEKNYYKDLKLETLAEIFNYNSAYLGKIFKNYTTESFNTYVDKIRIENAKKLLLENNLKVYKISEKVGYKNTDYFYGKFKKYVGISPKEFTKKSGIAMQ